MIATISFALLVVIAVGYVLLPLIAPRADGRRTCRGCGAALPDAGNYCIACGQPLDERGQPGIIQPGER